MANIYELTESIKLLWDLMDQGELDDDVLKDAMMNSQEDLKDKLEGYCKFIRQMESDVDGVSSEIKRLQDRKAVLKNTIERSKKSCKWRWRQPARRRSRVRSSPYPFRLIPRV